MAARRRAKTLDADIELEGVPLKRSRKTPSKVIEDKPPKTKFDETERKLPPIQPKTAKQGEYLHALRTSRQVICVGPAGCGKTWIPASWASDQIRGRKVEKVILIRPNISCSRSLGYMPGGLEDKYLPFLAPITETMKARMGVGAFDTALKNGLIELLPLEVARGRSFDGNWLVLVDEVQNITPHEAKMLMTRAGENCTMVLTGDVSQSDIGGKSGLSTIIHLVKKYMLPVPIIEMTEDDIVRSDLTAQWVKAFFKEGI